MYEILRRGMADAIPMMTAGSVPEESFGIAGQGPFAGSRHVGSDVAWFQCGQAVLSPAAGEVKAVVADQPSWGGLVIIEHQTEDGPVCSLLSHLDRVILVREGQPVAAGEVVGALGASFTFANGGYGSHLHLGIYQGPYGKGSWVAGYVRGKGGTGKWTNPLLFFRDRGVEIP